MSANCVIDCSENYFFIVEDDEVLDLEKDSIPLQMPKAKEYTNEEILLAVIQFYYTTARWPKSGHAAFDKACGWNDFTAKFAKRFNLPSYRIVIKHFGTLLVCLKEAEKLAHSRNEEFYQKEIV